MAVDLAKLREMDARQLETEENELRSAIWKLRLQMTTGQVQDPTKVRRARKELARVLTVKREQELSSRGEKKR